MKGEPQRRRRRSRRHPPPLVLPGRLRALRLAARLTQRELARRCGVSVQAVFIVETDRRQPSAALLRKLKRILGQVPREESDAY